MQKLQHQTQPCPYSCVCTSVAILAGVPAQQLVEKYHQGYRDGTVTVRQILDGAGLKYVTFDSLDGGDLSEEGAYLVTVPSLNLTGGNHQIVIEVAEDDYYVIDPVKGRTNRHYYVKRGDVSSVLEFELGGFRIDAFFPDLQTLAPIDQASQDSTAPRLVIAYLAVETWRRLAHVTGLPR